MCMQVVECCGKNPHLQVAIPHLWCLHLIPADYTLCLLPEDCVENRIIPRVSGAISRV